MKKILCFGDSNTYGYNPENGSRYDIETRWSGILKTSLKNKYDVIEAGCNNRTCFIDSLDGIEKTGYKILPDYLTKEIDILILALGINDLQKFYSVSLDEVEIGIEKIILIARNINSNIKIILVSPSKLSTDVLNGVFSFQFDENSIRKSAFLSGIYKKTALKHNCKFIDLNNIAKVSNKDGLHYEPYEHKKISEAIYNLVNLT